MDETDQKFLWFAQFASIQELKENYTLSHVGTVIQKLMQMIGLSDTQTANIQVLQDFC